MLARLLSNRHYALVLILLLALVYPYTVSIALWAHWIEPAGRSSPLSIGVNIIFELCLLALLDRTFRHQGRSWKDIGLTFSWRDILVSLALFIGGYLIFYIAYVVAWYVSIAVTGRPFEVKATNVDFMRDGQIAMMLIYVIINPFFEELIIRAYPMTELFASKLSDDLIIVLSVVVQTGYHVYQGIPSMLLLSTTFFLFALYYARTRRALPIVLAHLYLDMFALLSSR